jgi:hypothetical protein
MSKRGSTCISNRARGSRNPLALTRYNGLFDLGHIAPVVLIPFLLPDSIFTLLARQNRSISCRCISSYPRFRRSTRARRNWDKKPGPTCASQVRPVRSTQRPTLNHGMNTALPGHSHADSIRYVHASRITARPKQLVQRHSSNAQTFTIQNS